MSKKTYHLTCMACGYDWWIDVIGYNWCPKCKSKKIKGRIEVKKPDQKHKANKKRFKKEIQFKVRAKAVKKELQGLIERRKLKESLRNLRITC